MKGHGIHKLCHVLVIIGGLNWGLVGLGMLFGSMHDMSWNVVHMILGSWPIVEGIVYLLVGICAVCMMFGHGKKKMAMQGGMGGQM